VMMPILCWAIRSLLCWSGVLVPTQLVIFALKQGIDQSSRTADILGKRFPRMPLYQALLYLQSAE
jgi:hypothetical protein